MEYLTEEFPGKGDKAMDAKIDEIVKQVINEVKTSAAGQNTVKADRQLQPDNRIQSEGKGACLTGPENYEIKQFEIPVPGEKEVLVRVEGCIVSESDAQEFLKGIPGYQCPAVGEEGTGRVVKVGSSPVKDIHGRVIKEGDLVTTLGSVNGKKSGYGDKKKECRPSGWYSSYVLLREDMKILQMNDLDQDSRMLYRQASEAAASVDRICKLYKPETYAKIAVAGCRTAGLLTIAALKCAGFSDIIAIDEDEECLALAEKMGARHKVLFTCKNGVQGMVEKTKSCFGGELADLALQCVELPGRNSIVRRFVRAGGNTADMTKRVRTQLTREAYSQGEKVLRLAQTAEIPLYRLITHRFHLEEINQANWTVLSGAGHICAVLNR